MYPLPENTLSVRLLAYHWSLDLAQRPRWQDVYLRLLASIWRGELEVIWQPAKPDTRRQLLEMYGCGRSYGNVLIFPDTDSIPENTAPTDKEAVAIVPKDPTKWDATVIHAACNKLAASDHEEAFERWSIFMTLPVSRESFQRYCLESGYPLPPFWFGPHSQKVLTAKARRDCENWLIEQVRAGGKPGPKAILRREAKKMFPRLSGRGFEEVWANTVPDAWRRAGAPAGERDR
jgi:hypothetical protein